MSMRFIYEAGVERVMHIQKTDNAGQPEMKAVCGADHNFNRTVNAPWTLRRGVCPECESQIR